MRYEPQRVLPPQVTQTAVVNGQPLLMFSCLGADLSTSRRETTSGGIWAATAPSILGPYDIADAQLITDTSRYVGRIIHDRASGQAQFLAFVHDGDDGQFVGGISDPQPIRWDGDHFLLEKISSATVTGNRTETTNRLS